MSLEHRESVGPPIYEIDLSKAWDMPSQVDDFFEGLRKLGIYRPNLRFSGFNGAEIGKKFSSEFDKNTVFCSTENDLRDDSSTSENALNYAFEYGDNAAIAVYDGDRLEGWRIEGAYDYKIKDSSALIAIILFK